MIIHASSKAHNEEGISRRRLLGSLLAAGAWSVASAEANPEWRAARNAWRQEASRIDGQPAAFLNFNENPYPPPPQVLQAIGNAALRANRYPDQNEMDFTEYLAGHHQVAANQVLLGCGSVELLHAAAAAFSGPQRAVVVADPTFEALAAFAGLVRAPVVKVPVDRNLRHSLEGMSLRSAKNTGMVYVCNPNNPTGTIVTNEDMQKFLDKLPRGVVVLVDEAYFHFANDPGYASCIPRLRNDSRLIVLRTFSKLYGLAGLRIGYAVGSPENIQLMDRHRTPTSVNVAALGAARACMENQSHYDRILQQLLKTRERLASGLAALGWSVVPSQANFVMADTGADVESLIKQLAAEGIYVGRKFPVLGTYLRVSLGTDAEINRFLLRLKNRGPR